MSATDSYVTSHERAAAQIAKITAALAAHHDATPADATNWGHVGDLNRFNELLAEAIAFLTGAES